MSELFVHHHGRIRLRRVGPADASTIAAYRSDPEVAMYQSWTTYTLADAERLCTGQRDVAINTPGTWAQLAIVLTATDEMIGDCGLHFLEADGREIEIGITLSRDHQGQGLASDAVAAIAKLAFGSLGKHAIRATVDARNAGARALLERAGFKPVPGGVKRVMFKGEWCDEIDYVLRAHP